MYGLLIVFCCIGLSLAIPQGYNYEVKSPTTFTSSSSSSQLTGNKPIQYFNKQFFIHTAPEESYDAKSFYQPNLLSLKKNLRVLFIKSPNNNGLTNAAKQLAKEQISAQTIIYVFNKQTDVEEFQNKLDKLNEINPNKPEVHFVRYKTSDEAEHAQKSIQAQYDHLGGSSEVSNEGVPPVISFVGLTNSYQPQQVGFGSNNQLANTYLPATYV